MGRVAPRAAHADARAPRRALGDAGADLVLAVVEAQRRGTGAPWLRSRLAAGGCALFGEAIGGDDPGCDAPEARAAPARPIAHAADTGFEVVSGELSTAAGIGPGRSWAAGPAGAAGRLVLRLR